MAEQKGSALLIAVGDGASPEVFTTVAGLRTKSMSINRETVDITNSDSTGIWRDLLVDAGVRSVSVSGSGVFTDAAVDETLRAEMFGTTVANKRITVPDFGTFTGAFHITDISYAGEHAGEVTYDVSLESAGVITFAAAA